MHHPNPEPALTQAGGEAGRLADRRVPAVAVLSGGGFSFETKRLLQSLEQHLRFLYLATEFGGTPGTDGIPAGVRVAVPSFASVTRPSVWRSLRAFARTFLISRQVLSGERQAIVVVIGCSHAVPALLAARLARRPCVFVESITRTDRLSLTGRLVYRLRLADRFIVQWPSLQRVYPRSVLGTVL